MVSLEPGHTNINYSNSDLLVIYDYDDDDTHVYSITPDGVMADHCAQHNGEERDGQDHAVTNTGALGQVAPLTGGSTI